jgi:hypothetical protein
LQRWDAFLQDVSIAGIVTPPPSLVTVPFNATPVFDGSTGSAFGITLTGNVASSSIANLVVGIEYIFLITQDGAGNHTFVWPAGTIGGMVIDPTAGSVSVQAFVYDGTVLRAISAGISGAALLPTTIASVVTSSVVSPSVNSVLVVDGVTYTTVQAALNALPATGGWVQVPPGTYVGPTTIPSNCRITGYVPTIPSATWNAATNLVGGTSPADGGKVTFTYTSTLTITGLWHTTIEGITFDFGGTNHGLNLQNGAFDNDFDITIQNCGTGTALTMNSGGAAGQGVVLNRFRRLNIFNAGRGLMITGTSPGSTGNNLFDWLFINNISTTAIELVQQADTNSFGFTFIAGLADTATGILFNNSGSPTLDKGVQSNVWRHLVVDAFTPASYTGTVLKFNQSRGNQITSFELGGGLSGGTVIGTPAGAPTFSINFAGNFTNHDYDCVNFARRNVFHGTALTTADYAISAGWGNTAAKGGVSGTSSGGNFAVTANGAGIAANPTVVLTFPDGAWNLAPFAIAVPETTATVAAGINAWATTAQNTTTVTFTFLGTPNAGQTYGLMFHCFGFS